VGLPHGEERRQWAREARHNVLAIECVTSAHAQCCGGVHILVIWPQIAGTPQIDRASLRPEHPDKGGPAAQIVLHLGGNLSGALRGRRHFGGQVGWERDGLAQVRDTIGPLDGEIANIGEQAGLGPWELEHAIGACDKSAVLRVDEIAKSCAQAPLPATRTKTPSTTS
jgi:hypothetical protein